MFNSTDVAPAAPPGKSPMILPREKIDLIYVAGCGRSGSTLLDAVLGAHPAVVSVGEAWYHARWQANNFACTCGAPFNACEFWQAVAAKLRQWKTAVAITPVTRHREKLLSVLQLYTGAPLLSAERVNRYGRASYQLFKAVQRVAGKTVVLDSSKNPLRLLYLCLSGYFNVKIIHLVRDGRAYVNSTSKRVQMPAQEGWISPQNVWRTTGRWILTNSLSRRVCAELPDIPSCLIKYEEFSAAPEAATRRLCEFLQLEYGPAMLEGAGAAAHNISGSRWRYQARRAIRLDEAWRQELAPRRLLVFSLLGGWLNRQFGYQ
ncbi:sulfotransferase [candidate division KSB1 bacterium]|nr:sulfotransferase [candidate division KSB1 bacterium]